MLMPPIGLSRYALFAYGLFGLPLALVALPIYVYVPQFYAEHLGLSLTLIGSALLVARMMDAFIDPLCGFLIDRFKYRRGYAYFILFALPLLIFGFVALFQVPDSLLQQPVAWRITWLFSSLLFVYSGFSLATIAYQSWGAALSQVRQERVRLTGTREACGLAGVVIAAALPSIGGIGWLTTVFVGSLLISAVWLLWQAPRPVITVATEHSGLGALLIPFFNIRFRWLFSVFVINGIAAAIPATLFLFFAKDVLQLGSYAGLFLILYFVAAAITLPVWIKLAQQHGEATIWWLSMLIAIAAFSWVYFLSAGSTVSFALICIASGIALGADLALPPALLAAVIADANHQGRFEGAYFGVWSWATKINLALAAGIALPLLDYLGYTPGVTNFDGTSALRLGYAVVPCALKILATLVLWRAPLKTL
jgi:GPH family glycoside/pentoside/hexuronide:cation symporter